MKIKSMLRPIVKPAAAALAGLIILTAPAQAFAATDYKAKTGDTFWKLSRSFDVPLQKLMSFNKDVKPTNIYPGMTLSIPASAKSNSSITKSSKKNNSVKAASTKGIQMLTKDDGAKHIIAPSGTSYKIGRTLNIKASAYTSAASENGKWGAVDYFGNPLKVGTVAVDPKEIPLGTKLYITGYDYNGLPDGGMIATASDVGGAIKGERIDLFVPGTTSQAKVFGYQWVKVHVLK